MSKNTLSSDSNRTWKEQVQFERLQQARWTHRLALVSAVATLSITLVGAAGLMLNRVQEGAATAATGLLGTVRSSQLCKDANDRLDKLLAEHNKE